MSWLRVSTLGDKIRRSLPVEAEKLAVELKELLQHLDPQAETLPGSGAWALVARATGKRDARLGYLRTQVTQLECLVEMGEEKSGGIRQSDLDEVVEELEAALR